MTLCANKHPELPVTCLAPEAFPNHDEHFGVHEGEQVAWDNPNFVRPIPGQKADPDRRYYVRSQVTEVANWVRRGEDVEELSQPPINVE